MGPSAPGDCGDKEGRAGLPHVAGDTSEAQSYSWKLGSWGSLPSLLQTSLADLEKVTWPFWAPVSPVEQTPLVSPTDLEGKLGACSPVPLIGQVNGRVSTAGRPPGLRAR